MNLISVLGIYEHKTNLTGLKRRPIRWLSISINRFGITEYNWSKNVDDVTD